MSGLINYEINGNANGLLAAVRSSQSALGGLGGAASASSLVMTAGFAAATAGLAALAGVAALAGKSLKEAMATETIEVGINTILKNAQLTKAVMSDMQDLAAHTPLQMGDLAASSKLLLGSGTAVKDLRSEITMLGDVANGAQVDLQRVVLVYNQIRAAGQLHGHSLLELNTMGVVGMREELAKLAGVNLGTLNKQIEAGKVTADMVTQAFRNMTSQGGVFFHAMENQSKTTHGLLTTLEDEIKSVFRALGEPLNDMVKPLLGGWINLLHTAANDTRTFVTALGQAASVGMGGSFIAGAIGTGLKKAANAFFAEMQDGWAALGQFLPASLGGLEGTVSAALANAGTTFGRALDGAATLFHGAMLAWDVGALGSYLWGGLETAVGQFSPALMQAMDAAAQFFNAAMQAFDAGTLRDFLTGALVTSATRFQEALTTAVSDGLATMPGWAQDFGFTLLRGVNTAADALKGGLENASVVWRAGMDAYDAGHLGEFLGAAVWDGLKMAADAFRDYTIAQFRLAVDALVGMVQKFGGKIPEILANPGGALVNALTGGKVGAGINTAVAGLGKGIAGAAGGGEDPFQKALRERREKDAKEGIKPPSQTFQKGMEQAGKPISSQVFGQANDTAAQHPNNAFTDFLKIAVDKLTGDLAEMAKAMQDAKNQPPQAPGAAGGVAVPGAAAGVGAGLAGGAGGAGKDDLNGDGIVSRREKRKAELEHARAERHANSIGLSDKGKAQIADRKNHTGLQDFYRMNQGRGFTPGADPMSKLGKWTPGGHGLEDFYKNNPNITRGRDPWDKSKVQAAVTPPAVSAHTAAIKAQHAAQKSGNDASTNLLEKIQKDIADVANAMKRVGGSN